ncbi:hypothetical protein [Nocardiopsis sp. NRRL B-16309]|uniref:hypothetical protein n=1 Tax=Nocardiopsis sp. NRRL B-16309 TaxID=1519494 RepID=UPI0006AF456C|nr:hypothetical protein [Nocardiopsis sp. NRRL B-16309]KOX13361.1 hypothetical protein ADL05_19105 [Nocardiopsis sp. NRRL B-16309]
MLKRTGTASLAVLVGVLVAPPPAGADPGSFLGQVECGGSGGPGCSIMLRWSQEQGGTPGAPGTPGSGGTGATPSVPGPYDHVDWDAIDWENAVDWDAIDWDSVDYSGGEGEGGEEGGPATDATTAIQEAIAAFELPAPKISTSPDADGLVLVHTPVWLWVEEEDWADATATAEVPGLSMTVTAVPSGIRWTMGDGTEIVCEGSGTPYDPAAHDPASESPDCGHVYTRASGTQDGGAYTVTAAINWEISWEFSDGTNGTLGTAATSSEVAVTVEEAQGLVSGSGR